MSELYPPTDLRLLEAAQELPTPAIIYDFGALDLLLERMLEDVALIPDARLNLAVKACHTLPVLQRVQSHGLGCDVASLGELELAQAAGFDEISCTGPAFSVADFECFRAAGIIPDVDSLSQLETYGKAFPGGEVGLRLRMEFPSALEGHSTFTRDSRFGIEPDHPRLGSLLEQYGLKVTRFHLHTGQTTPEALVFKARFLLSQALRHEHAQWLDVGGGFFHLYPQRRAARQAFATIARMAERFARRRGRPVYFRFEPGGGILTAIGYLVSEIRAVEFHRHWDVRLLTLDASAWNLAPWHKPKVAAVAPRTGPDSEVLLAGNTLYEGDFFGRDVSGRQSRFMLGPCQVGDRLLITSAGAYTLTNSRLFNRIPLPREYVFLDGRLQVLEPTHGRLPSKNGKQHQELALPHPH
ncbi:MAG: hypothetical protein AB7S38_27320 [Vulcanimicrobiota bacterium]